MSYGKSMFSFVKNCHFTFSQAMNESSQCSASLPGFGGVSVLVLAILIGR